VIDHLKLFVADPAASRAFYERALEPLGYRVLLEPGPGVVGMGADRPDFWLAPAAGPTTTCHVAFGAPGMRPYHPHYYGAFVLDPDGNNVEAVFHGATPG